MDKTKLAPKKIPTRSSTIDDHVNTKREILIFSDFDGTIALQDTGHLLFDKHGCGPERRQQLDDQIHSGERSFREVSEEMWGSLHVGFDDGFDVMKEKLVFDPDFSDFHAFCVRNKIPFNVISAGLKPLLRAVLEHHLGPEAAGNIDIISNDMRMGADGQTWEVVWRDDTPLGHDKAASIQTFKGDSTTLDEDELPPLIVFIGDGVSDLPAAREADILFARRGLKLENYCIENKIPYIPFDSFASIKREIQRLAAEDKKAEEETGVPKFFNPRANFWRRASSKGTDGVVTLATMKEAMKSTSSLHSGAKTPTAEQTTDPIADVRIQA